MEENAQETQNKDPQGNQSVSYHPRTSKQKSSFQITSVVLGAPAISDESENDSDYDGSRTKGTSEIIRINEMVNAENSTEEICISIATATAVTSQTDTAMLELTFQSEIISTPLKAPLMLPELPETVENIEASPPQRNDRFKVVKIETNEPFRRGRWMCMDYLDPKPTTPENSKESSIQTPTVIISNQINVNNQVMNQPQSSHPSTPINTNESNITEAQNQATTSVSQQPKINLPIPQQQPQIQQICAPQPQIIVQPQIIPIVTTQPSQNIPPVPQQYFIPPNISNNVRPVQNTYQPPIMQPPSPVITNRYQPVMQCINPNLNCNSSTPTPPASAPVHFVQVPQIPPQIVSVNPVSTPTAQIKATVQPQFIPALNLGTTDIGLQSEIPLDVPQPTTVTPVLKTAQKASQFPPIFLSAPDSTCVPVVIDSTFPGVKVIASVTPTTITQTLAIGEEEPSQLYTLIYSIKPTDPDLKKTNASTTTVQDTECQTTDSCHSPDESSKRSSELRSRPEINLTKNFIKTSVKNNFCSSPDDFDPSPKESFTTAMCESNYSQRFPLKIDSNKFEKTHPKLISTPVDIDYSQSTANIVINRETIRMVSSEEEPVTPNYNATIGEKIEQAMDLVKTHLMCAANEEIKILKDTISDLLSRITELENENRILKRHISQELLNQLLANSMEPANSDHSGFSSADKNRNNIINDNMITMRSTSSEEVLSIVRESN